MPTYYHHRHKLPLLCMPLFVSPEEEEVSQEQVKVMTELSKISIVCSAFLSVGETEKTIECTHSMDGDATDFTLLSTHSPSISQSFIQ